MENKSVSVRLTPEQQNQIREALGSSPEEIVLTVTPHLNVDLRGPGGKLELKDVTGGVLTPETMWHG